MFKTRFMACAALAASMASLQPALALEPGDWMVRVGVGTVMPNVDSDTTPNIPGGQVDVSNGTSLTLNFGYMMTDNLALDLLAAWPFSHDIEGAGALAGAGNP